MNSPRPSFLLLIGDDGAILLPPQNGEAEAALYAPSHCDEDSAAILHRFARDPATPVLILADTLTQTYKIEELPRLSFFDRRKLIAKRLEQAFPKTLLTSSMNGAQRQALLFALDTKGAVDLWLARLATLTNPSGVCGLLPLECADMIAVLVPESRNGWGLLLATHETGGLRQIVTHNGHFVFTRLTAPLSDTTSEGFKAATLAQDVKATRDYLARFGLSADTPLHMAAILPESLHATMSVTPMDVTTRRHFTPHEAATALHLPFAPAPHETMADLIALLWVSSKRLLRGPLMPDYLREEQKQQLIRKTGLAVALGMVAVALIVAGIQAASLLGLMRDVDQTRAEVAALDSQLAQAQATLAPAAEPLGRLRLAAERQRLFVQNEQALFKLLPPIAEALGEQARVTTLGWHDKTLTLDVKLHDTKSFKIEEIMAVFDALHQKLRASLPNTHVEKTGAAASTNSTLSNEPKTDAPPATTRFTITTGAP